MLKKETYFLIGFQWNHYKVDNMTYCTKSTYIALTSD